MVKSSFIKNVVLGKSGAIRVFLKNGLCYQYAKVGKRKYNAFMKAESKGTFYNTQIKPFYKCKEVVFVKAKPQVTGVIVVVG
jgi:hypothetical protein